MRHDKILYKRTLNKITKTISVGRSTFSNWEQYDKSFKQLVEQKVINKFEIFKEKAAYGYITRAYVKCEFPKESGGKMVKLVIYE